MMTQGRPTGTHFEAQAAPLEALLGPSWGPSWGRSAFNNMRFVQAKRYFLLVEAVPS